MQDSKQSMKTMNRVFSIFLFVSFVTLFFVSEAFPVKAAIYPRALLIVGMASSVGLFISSCIGQDELKKVNIGRQEGKMLLLSILLMTIYILLINRLGYAVSTFFYMFSQMAVLRANGKKISYMLIAIVSTGILFGVFGGYLGVWLPKGILF